MTKLRVAGAVVVLILVVLVLHSCRGGGGGSSVPEADPPEVVDGVVSIPACSTDTRSDALRVAVYQPVGGQVVTYDKVQTCLGISETMLTRIKQLGAVGLPAYDRLVLVVVDLRDNRFRVCGLSDQSDDDRSVPAAAMTCRAGQAGSGD